MPCFDLRERQHSGTDDLTCNAHKDDDILFAVITRMMMFKKKNACKGKDLMTVKSS